MGTAAAPPQGRRRLSGPAPRLYARKAYDSFEHNGGPAFADRRFFFACPSAAVPSGNMGLVSFRHRIRREGRARKGRTLQGRSAWPFPPFIRLSLAPSKPRLQGPDPCPEERGRSRRGQPRSSRLRADRSGQDGRLRPRHGSDASGGQTRSASRQSARLDHRADARTGSSSERRTPLAVRRSGARIVTCVGGMDARTEQKALFRGAHLVVGTPGRLRDHLERGNLRTQDLRVAVLDEADEMLNLGFREDLEFILEATPAERRTLLFSATLPKPIVALTKRYRRTRCASRSPTRAPAIRTSSTAHPRRADRGRARGRQSPASGRVADRDRLLQHARAGPPPPHRSSRPRVRSRVALGRTRSGGAQSALQALRDGRSRVCVATDVAARGIDLPNLGS